MQKSSTTGYSPFELLNGQSPVAPHTILMRGFLRSPHAKKFMKAWDETLELAWLRLHEAIRRIKKCIDKDRWDACFSVGDIIFLKITED